MLRRQPAGKASAQRTWSRSSVGLLAACVLFAGLVCLSASADDSKPQSPPRKDLYGDPLPDGALARLGSTRFRHVGAVTYVAFTPDGKALLSVGQDNTIRLWELKTGKELRRFGARKPDDAAAVDNLQPQMIAFQIQIQGRGVPLPTGFRVNLAADGKTLAVSKPGNPIQLWEVATGKELRQVPAPANGVNMLLLSPNGKTLVARSSDQTLYFWDAETGQEIRRLKPQEANGGDGVVRLRGGSGGVGPINLAFSPDGKLLAASESILDKQMLTTTVKLLATDTGKETHQMPVKQGQRVSTLSFAPDGKLLAYSAGAAIYLADPHTGKDIRQIEGQQTGVAALSFSPDGKTLASKRGSDGLVRLWDVQTGNALRDLANSEAARSDNVALLRGGVNGAQDLAFSPDGKLVAVGGGSKVRFWEADSGNEVAQDRGHRSSVTALVLSADGKTVVSKGADNTVRLWDAATGKQRHQFHVPAGTICAALSPDAQTVALGNRDNSIQVHEVATGKELHKFTGHQNGISAVAFSPDGKVLASRGSSDYTIRLYDPVAGRDLRVIAMRPPSNDAAAGQGLVLRLYGRGTPGPGLVFSPDGTLLASPVDAPGGGQGQSTLNLWDVATGKEVRKIALSNQSRGGSFAFAPDGRTLATENTDLTVTLWEVASGKKRGQLGSPVVIKASSPQSGIMVLGGGFLNTGGGPAATPTLVFTSDGRALLTKGPDQSIRVWDVSTGKEVGQLKGHEGSITALAIAANGRTMATGSTDTTILLWDLAHLQPPSAPPSELRATEVEAAWTALVGNDAVVARQEILALARAPKQAVAFLRERLQPAAVVDPRTIAQWVADLDSEKFTVRQRATQELEKLGELAVPALNKVATSKGSLETQRRAEQLLEKVTGRPLSGEQLRMVRGVEVLEQIGTSEARQVLQTLARGADGALPTREAQRSLERLSRRASVQP